MSQEVNQAARGARAALLGAALYAMGTGAGAAQSAPQTAPQTTPQTAQIQREVFRDWELLRDPQGACLLRQAVISRASGTVFLEAYLLPGSGAQQPGAAIAFRVPIGAYLPDGIAYRHPESPAQAIGLEWQDCGGQTCSAAGRLSPEELARLMKGSEVTVAYRPLPSAPPLNLPLSLMGLTKGWAALQACAAG